MAVSLPVVYVLVPATATVVAAMLAITAWSRRDTLGAAPFTVVLLSVAAWAFAYTMELLSTDVAGTLFWAKASYLGVEVLPVAWILFALEYSGNKRWSSRSLLGLLSIEPIVFTVLVWTNEAHGLVWTDTTPIPFGDILVMTYSYGPAFWVNTVYAYGSCSSACGCWRSSSSESRPGTAGASAPLSSVAAFPGSGTSCSRWASSHRRR